MPVHLIALLAGLLASLLAQAEAPLPRGEARPGYADEAVCQSCHPAQAQAWRGSKHRLAMQEATPETLLGDFGKPPPAALHYPVQFSVRHGQPMVSTQNASGQRQDFPVSRVLGVRPLQQLLLPMPGGRLQAFTLAWDTVRHRWFDLQADEETPPLPGSSLHWSGRYQNWNLMCAECHTTALRKNYDAAADRYQTTWALPHVGCQACHGPAAEHAAGARLGRPPPTLGALLKKAGHGEVDRCASCHARRTRLVELEDPAGHFLDNFQPDNLRPELYHPDGQQKAEVFEYGSYRQSRMHEAGVVCSDCHEPHGGGLLTEGNALCVRCHNPAPNPRYPGLKAGRYDDAGHHFHRAGEAGSQCVDCHMPTQNYMVVHARRDHAVRIPRPDLSRRLGTPNACTLCHRDKDAAWAEQALVRRFGNPARPAHYGEIFAGTAQDPAESAPALAALGSDPKQPAIVRATAIERLARIAPQLVPPAATRDPDPVVRSAAAQAMAAWPAESALLHLLPLLDDARRAVRIAAARSLAGVASDRLPAPARPLQQRGLAEFVVAQQAMADMPAAQLNLAALRDALQQPSAAGEHYAIALRQDPYLLAARLGLARWQLQNSSAAEAETTLRAGLALPGAVGAGELHEALGRLLFGQGRRREAEQELTRAVALRPEDARLRQQLMRLRDALRAGR